MKLVRPEDGAAYEKENFNKMMRDRFKFFILTKNIFPSEKLVSSTFVIRIHIPE